MSAAAPQVSIVIPTRNRRDALARDLAALARQSYPANAFEVIVSSDATPDDSREMASGTEWPFRLVWTGLETPSGAAAARNLGASLARGALLVFLDDDVEPCPDLVEAHVEAVSDPLVVSIGYLPPEVNGRNDLFAITLRAWWESIFERMRVPGHRFGFCDVLAGNLAIPSSLFRKVGGFDSSLRCHEDYEIGVRLLEAGARFRFSETARAVHHEATTLGRALVRKREEGRADVQMARRHPGIVRSLPLGMDLWHPTAAALERRRRVFELRGGERRRMRRAMGRLRAYERIRMRGRWRALLDGLLFEEYWWGVSDEIPSLAALGNFIDECCRKAPGDNAFFDADVARGIETVLAEIEQERPSAARLRLGDWHVGDVPAVAGTVPIDRSHVQWLMGHHFAAPLLRALARSGTIGLEIHGPALESRPPVPSRPLGDGPVRTESL